ncbi:MAG: adenylyltransferase/cytidyltransferase family protein [Acidobacteria bacterium]|nr:adenylyltransferase/cytidyltransferase family protein [Acidobacteriota bacterium]
MGTTADLAQGKIRTLEELEPAIREEKNAGKRVIHCHGVFDLLHVGHIKHLQASRDLGDILVVTITPDRYVNKGPHRPAFTERLRAEALAALSTVDYVAVNAWPSAVETIKLLRPHVFVKGFVRDGGQRDHTDAIEAEEEAIRSVGGQLMLTDEETFSATNLINRNFDVFLPDAKAFLERFRQHHTAEEMTGRLQEIREMKVLAIGETIIDEYVFCEVMGKANKDPILAGRFLHSEKYGGGILAIANHLAPFCDHVGLLSVLGEVDSQIDFITTKLDGNVHAHFVRKPESPTIVKRRFLQDYMSIKLFEMYVMQNEQMSPSEEAVFCQKLKDLLPRYDVVVVADYGHGLFTERTIDLLAERARFLAVNAQTNAGNRGFNFISRYPRADYISIDEPEARLETRNQKADIKDLILSISKKTSCKRLLVTRGKHGVCCYEEGQGFSEVPAFAVKVVDRLGAGDAVLAMTAPCAALGLPMDVVGFIGNVAGAEACGILGNKSGIDRASFFRHITSLLK